MRLMAGTAAIPAIGLPGPAEAAPITGVTVEQAVEVARMTLRDMPRGCYIYYCGHRIRYDPTWPEAGFVVWSHVHCADDWDDFPRMPLDGPYKIPNKPPSVPASPQTTRRL